jgi:hypothetical protein
LQPFQRWAIICSYADAEDDPRYGSWINHFVKELRKAARGDQNISQPDVYQIMDGSGRWEKKDDLITLVKNKVKNEQTWKSYQIVLFVIPRRGEQIYRLIKQATNTEIRVPTQVLVAKNLQEYNGPILLGLWLQIQTKVFFCDMFYVL